MTAHSTELSSLPISSFSEGTLFRLARFLHEACLVSHAHGDELGSRGGVELLIGRSST